jgi:thiamine-phosphate pyrophosphorylase
MHDLDLLIAGDEGLARALNADGIHLSEAEAARAFHVRATRPDWLITVSAHTEHVILKAFRADADAVLLAPLFPTKSHPDKPEFGTARFRQIAARAPLPVYALGGVTAANAGRLDGAELAGIAAIEALLTA